MIKFNGLFPSFSVRFAFSLLILSSSSQLFAIVAVGWYWHNTINQRCGCWFLLIKERWKEVIGLSFFLVGMNAGVQKLGVMDDWMVDDGWVFRAVKKKKIGM